MVPNFWGTIGYQMQLHPTLDGACSNVQALFLGNHRIPDAIASPFVFIPIWIRLFSFICTRQNVLQACLFFSRKLLLFAVFFSYACW